MKSLPSLKKFAFLPMLVGASAALHAGSPLLDLGESACAYFICDAAVTYNDNIFATHNKTDDVIFSISPGVQVNIGRESNNQLVITAREELKAYIDHDNLNNQLANVNAVWTYDAGSALSSKVWGNFQQVDQNTNTIGVDGSLIERNLYGAGVHLSYKITAKSILEAGFNFNAVHFTDFRELYNDQSTYSVPVSWLYQVTDKLFAGLTYQYSYTDIEGTNGNLNPFPGNQQVHFAGLTARGDLTEKITIEGNAGVGYSIFNDRRIFTGNDLAGNPTFADDDRNDTTFNFSLKANYQVTEKFVASLQAGRSFNVGGQAQAYTNTFFNLHGNYAISPHWEANGYVGYALQSFDGRNGGDDNIFSAGVGISYLPNQYWRITLGYNFMNDDSDRIQNYNINTVSLTAALKY